MKKTAISLAILLFGTMPSMAYEYPTEETIRYALNCMTTLGGQTDQNLYTCSCRYDSIREVLPFDDYADGKTYERNRAMPGKKVAFLGIMSVAKNYMVSWSVQESKLMNSVSS